MKRYLTSIIVLAIAICVSAKSQKVCVISDNLPAIGAIVFTTNNPNNKQVADLDGIAWVDVTDDDFVVANYYGYATEFVPANPNETLSLTLEAIPSTGVEYFDQLLTNHKLVEAALLPQVIEAGGEDSHLKVWYDPSPMSLYYKYYFNNYTTEQFNALVRTQVIAMLQQLKAAGAANALIQQMRDSGTGLIFYLMDAKTNRQVGSTVITPSQLQDLLSTALF